MILNIRTLWLSFSFNSVIRQSNVDNAIGYLYGSFTSILCRFLKNN